MPASKDEIAARFFQHLEQYGMAKTSVEEVARDLGISKRTVYQHFSSKEDILRYVVEKAANATADRIGAEYASLPSYWARMERLVRELVMQATRDWMERFGGTEVRHQFAFGLRVTREAYDRLVREWAAEGAGAGEFHLIAEDAAVTARFIGAVLMDASEQVREERAPEFDDAVVEAVRKLLA